MAIPELATTHRSPLTGIPRAKRRLPLEICNSAGCAHADQFITVREAHLEPMIRVLDDDPINPNSTIRVAGSDFPRNVPVSSIKLGTGYAQFPFTNTDGNGEFEVPVRVPSLASGLHLVEVWAGDQSATTSLWVEDQFAPGPQPGPNPTIRVISDGTILPGDVIEVSGTGFPRYELIEDVTIGTVRATVDPGYPQPSWANTDRYGEFTVPVLVPQLASGVYQVQLRVGGLTATTSITVEDQFVPGLQTTANPTIWVNPSDAVLPGDTVEIVGSGFPSLHLWLMRSAEWGRNTSSPWA